MPWIKRKSEIAGIGCLFQGIGLLLLFFFPWGTLAGVGLLLWGSWNATKFICSECGNRVDNRQVKLCPACKAEFK
jgi:hypothetical protein